MPALVWFGRRWRTAADDFSFSSALYFSILAVCGVMGLTRISTARPESTQTDGEHAEFNYLPTCPEASFALGATFLGLSVTDLVAAMLFVATTFFSCRGAIFELSRRRLVPVCLYANLLTVAAILVMACIASKYTLYDGERRACTPLTRHILTGSLVLNLLVSFMFLLSFALVYDPSGRKRFESAEQYERTWWKRCRICFCRCGKEHPTDDAFTEVAKVFADAFCAYDIVPSDIAAGLLLLHGYQYHSRHIVRQRVHFEPADDDGHWQEKISTQAVPARPLSAHERQLLRELQQFSRFYLAAYGWMLYEFDHPCHGVVRLACADPFMCCRHHEGHHYGTKCFCDLAALLRTTHIPEEDVILTSWSNHVFKPVYYVCYDRASDAVVIAVRGTMSLTDMVTDLAATPEVVRLQPTGDAACAKYAESDYFFHGGMLRSARYVWRSLEYNGVFELLRVGKYASKRVIVLGHSLGAAVALTLSVLMHSDLPWVRERLRCLAYAPPGGTFSEAVVEYSKDFTVGAFLGFDMVPRLAVHTFLGLRDAIFDVTAASHIPKSLLFVNAMRTQEVTRTMHPSSAADGTHTGPSAESERYREGLREGSCVPVRAPQRLYPCKTLIHLRKAVERSSSALCGWCGESCCCCTCCGGPLSCVEEIYYPCMEGPKHVQAIIAAPTMWADHFPERLHDQLRYAVERIDRHELDRFYQNEEPTSDLEAAAPLHYVSPRRDAAPDSPTYGSVV